MQKKYRIIVNGRVYEVEVEELGASMAPNYPQASPAPAPVAAVPSQPVAAAPMSAPVAAARLRAYSRVLLPLNRHLLLLHLPQEAP